MILTFTPDNHKYQSLENDGIDWISVTSFISHFKQPFDADKMAEKSSKNKRSKWYGMTPSEIKAAWNAEATRATDLGTWYHNCREQDLCSVNTIERHGSELPIVQPLYQEGKKLSPNQKLTDGIYPEHLVYLRSAGLCGQSDLVEVVNNVVHITDYKTNKEIKVEGYTNWEGITQKMKPPVAHLDDCHLNHYTLQLSLYMFIILKHNPRLKPGTLTLHHILFEEQGRDKFNNPVTAISAEGDPIVKDIVQYDVPYLKEESIRLIHYLENNRSLIKKKN